MKTWASKCHALATRTVNAEGWGNGHDLDISRSSLSRGRDATIIPTKANIPARTTLTSAETIIAMLRIGGTRSAR